MDYHPLEIAGIAAVLGSLLVMMLGGLVFNSWEMIAGGIVICALGAAAQLYGNARRARDIARFMGWDKDKK